MADKCLVLGATGGIGRAIVKQLADEKKSIAVLCRNIEKAKKYLKEFSNVEIILGDAGNPEDLLSASQNCSTIFYCINTPYPEWEKTVRSLLKVSIDACLKNNAKLVFPGNVYSYGHAQYNKVDEMHPKFPHTKKGKIRLDMENMIYKACRDEGLKYTIVRLPDFYGPYVINGFSEQVFINALSGKPLKWIGNKSVTTEYIFIEDAAKAMVTVGLANDTYKKEYNIPGYSEITSEEFLNEIAKQGGKNSKLHVINSNLVFSVMGLFVPVIKEVKEMLYLKREKLILDGTQFTKKFGELPATPYEEGISKTLDWAKEFYISE